MPPNEKLKKKKGEGRNQTYVVDCVIVGKWELGFHLISHQSEFA